MVNLALSNGQVVSTTLANLQSIAQPQNMLNTPTSNGEFTGKTIVWLDLRGFRDTIRSLKFLLDKFEREREREKKEIGRFDNSFTNARATYLNDMKHKISVGDVKVKKKKKKKTKEL